MDAIVLLLRPYSVLSAEGRGRTKTWRQPLQNGACPFQQYVPALRIDGTARTQFERTFKQF